MASRFVPEADPSAFAVPEIEARALLVALFERGLPLWVFPANGSDDDYVISQILAVDGMRMELEIGPDRRWETMGAESALVVVSFLDRVKLQLAAQGQRRFEIDGEWRFQVTRKGPVHRLQRRDGYRLALMDEVAVCHLREADGTRIARPVIDVSVVGVAIAFPAEGVAPAIGRRFRGARLQLPERLVLPCDLVVRQVAEDPVTGIVRVGCAYEPMAPEVGRALQRAIMDLERRLFLPDQAD